MDISDNERDRFLQRAYNEYVSGERFQYPSATVTVGVSIDEHARKLALELSPHTCELSYASVCLHEPGSEMVIATEEMAPMNEEKVVLHKDLKSIKPVHLSPDYLICDYLTNYANTYVPSNPDGICFYDSLLAQLKHTESYQSTPPLSVMAWLIKFWPDYYLMSPDGRVEFWIPIRNMLQDRIYAPSSKDSPKSKSEEFFRLCCFRESACLNDNDEDYCNAIKVLMKEYLAGREGQVIVIKGVGETSMAYNTTDYLEYHWIPETIGKDFQQPNLDQNR